MRKFVVFDLDGTLLNTLPDIAGAMNRSLFRYGLPQHPEESYKAFTGNGARMLTRRAVAGHEEKLDAVYALYLHDYSQNSRLRSAPYPGIPETLQALADAGIALIVYSNKDDQDTRDVISHYFPELPFLAVLGARPEVPLKPAPDALDALLEELELDKKDGLYVGDTVMDMQCAREAGIPSVAVLWGFQPEEALAAEQPWAIISKPDELLALAKERFSL